MNRLILLILGSLMMAACTSPARTTVSSPENSSVFRETEVSRIENLLASDMMRGRKTFSPEIDLAASVIANEFSAAGLATWNNSPGYLQEFSLVRAKSISIKGNFDGREPAPGELMVLTNATRITLSDRDGYEKVYIKAEANLQQQARMYMNMNKNLLVLVDKKHAASFSNLNRLKSNFFKTDKNLVFVLSDSDPLRWSVEAEHEITEQRASNVLAILPGKSKAGEFVIFSAHYDHLGVGRPVDGDSIYNGANDDASGVTAMLILAKHYARLGPRERTLVFAAFTAEEIGGYGSQYFSRQFDPAAVVAMFNIEMIGTESKWGKNTAFITGYEKSNLGALMQGNLQGSVFTFHPDPYPDQQLFYRSDNATLARLGVPAHTISTAKMENEAHYHRPGDEVETLDLANMTKIIEAIATSAGSVVDGKETPTRVNPRDLR